MRAMLLEEVRQPLVLREIPDPVPGVGEIRVRVAACGVCRTDLHVADGELPDIRMPIIPGHEIVGYVDTIGSGVVGIAVGDRVGVPWRDRLAARVRIAFRGEKILCDRPEFTGYTRNGGFAELTVVNANYALPLGPGTDDVAIAPFLCAGLIGWRSLVRAGEAKALGIYGFGAAGHIVAQLARHQGRRVFAMTRPGDSAAQELARKFGAEWAGGSDEMPPERLDAAIIFAPVGALVPMALRALKKGGRVVCAGIHMSDIPAFPYRDLWGEREIVSVANLTRQDAAGFFREARRVEIKTETTPYPLERANEALADLRSGRIQGAAVLVP